MGDFNALFEILSDLETMQHYPKPFNEECTKEWIEWNIKNYNEYGFGLWAVVLKETNEMIGDCGLTLQNIDNELLPEIGYHIHKNIGEKALVVKRRKQFGTGYLKTQRLIACIPI